jgi:hypothetical protein
MDPKLNILIYCKLCSEGKGTFCTSLYANHIVCDELIGHGLMVEVEGPGGADRAFALTAAGELKISNIIMTKVE